MVRRLAPTLAVVCALPAASGTALADGSLLPEQPLSSAAAGSPTLAMAPNGYAAAAWEQPLAGAQFGVGVATRPPGGDWSRPQLLGASANDKFQLGVAVDAGGDAAVAWEEIVSPNALSFVASRAAGGAFTGPQQLTDATTVSSPVVGVDASGRVTLLYEPFPAMVVRDFQAGGLALAAPPQTLSDGRSSGCFGGSLVAVSPTGDAVAAADCNGAVFALRRAGIWSVSPRVANAPSGCPGTSTTNSADAVAIDAQGHAVGLLTNRVVQYTGFDSMSCQIFPPIEDDALHLVLPVGGFMTPLLGDVATARSTTFGAPIGAADIGVAPSGALAAWTQTDGSAMRLNVRDFALDGTPTGAAQPLDPTAYVFVPQVAVGADGRALVAWERYPGIGMPLPIELATRPPGGGFGPPLEVTPTGSQTAAFAAALDDGGDGAIAYLDDATRFAHVRGFDAGPPVLSGVTIPTGADADPGAPLAFAASASDVWGPVSLAWSFGDGTSANGGDVTHAYGAPGAYTATVTATDAAGNASSSSGVVHVGGGLGGNAKAPTLSHVSLTHRRFRVGRGRTATSARKRPQRVPVGTTFRYTVTLPPLPVHPIPVGQGPRVRIAIVQLASGRRSGSRCVKPTRRLARHRRCTRLLRVATLTRGVHASVNAVAFSGRIGRKALAPGSYRATLTPSMGSLVGASRTLGFVVVR